MKKKSFSAQDHLEVALTYYEDGLPHSAMCHVAAALLMLDGKPVPRGPKIWALVAPNGARYG